MWIIWPKNWNVFSIRWTQNLASVQLFFDLLWIHRQTDLWIAIDFAEGFDLRNYGLDSSYQWQIFILWTLLMACSMLVNIQRRSVTRYSAARVFWSKDSIYGDRSTSACTILRETQCLYCLGIIGNGSKFQPVQVYHWSLVKFCMDWNALLSVWFCSQCLDYPPSAINGRKHKILCKAVQGIYIYQALLITNTVLWLLTPGAFLHW